MEASIAGPCSPWCFWSCLTLSAPMIKPSSPLGGQPGGSVRGRAQGNSQQAPSSGDLDSQKLLWDCPQSRSCRWPLHLPLSFPCHLPVLFLEQVSCWRERTPPGRGLVSVLCGPGHTRGLRCLLCADEAIWLLKDCPLLPHPPPPAHCHWVSLQFPATSHAGVSSQ